MGPGGRGPAGLTAASSHPEFLDEVMVGACGRFSGLELPAAATLLLELHGSRRGVAEQQQQAGRDGAGTGTRCPGLARVCLGLWAMVGTQG